MNERTVLEAVDRLVSKGPAFPFSLTTVQQESKLDTSTFIRAMRSLRASGDVKVLDGNVTFAVNASLYKPGK